MPSRLIRDGLLESEAVLSLPIEARWLYVSILLSADDLGLFEATPFRLSRRADIRRESVEKLLGLLVDSDLVRLYQKDDRAFGFIPRFKQKLQIKRTKCPLPPDELFADDADMAGKVEALQESEATGELVGAFGKEWNELRLQVFARDGHACVRCRSTSRLSAHHITPKSLGGKHTIENLTTLCVSCNSWARNNIQNCLSIKQLVEKKVSGQILGGISAASTKLPEPEPEPEPKPKTLKPKTAPPTIADEGERAPQRSPLVALVCLLREHGADVTPANPQFAEWLERKVTDEQALAALEEAKRCREKQQSRSPIGAAYLTQILKSQLSAPKARTESHRERVDRERREVYRQLGSGIHGQPDEVEPIIGNAERLD